MTIDERIEALTMNLELMSHEVEGLRASLETLRASMETQRETAAQQHENIEELIPLMRDLVRVAAMHERRITRLEGQEPDPAL